MVLFKLLGRSLEGRQRAALRVLLVKKLWSLTTKLDTYTLTEMQQLCSP